MYEMTVSDNGRPVYDIVINSGFDYLTKYTESLDLKASRVCIISDSNVAPLYLDDLKAYFSDKYYVTEYVIEAGERSKTLSTIEKIYEHLILNKFDRHDFLVGLGGGVVGDMTGFTAATYLRGIDYINIPTSLLACVDSSVGGKTGVDFLSYKNMIGAFHFPSLVYINTELLKTLDKRQLSSGMAEVIKHALIKDRVLYGWLKENAEAIMDLDSELLPEMLYKSVSIKKDVVEEDPKEHGIRAHLNFGHTIGHAVEKHSEFELFHGEAVAIGTVAAMYICVRRGLISQEELEDAKKVLEAYGLKTSYKTDAQNACSEILSFTKHDKKMHGNHVKFVLLDGIGKAFTDETVEDDIIMDAIKSIL